jgi:hypothetical protein
MKDYMKPEEASYFWSPISPLPYIPKLKGAGKKILTISARYDPTFWPEFTESFFATMRQNDVPFESVALPCGHYSLGVAPFKYVVGYRFGTFLARMLR